MANRQPKLVLREACVEDLSRGWPPGRFLEVGAGTGYMTRKFLERGFHGTCYDLGSESRDILRRNLATYGDRMVVVDSLDALAPGSFDYLFAFEVLEHIEDDVGALAQWSRLLKPSGKFLMTVPAHMRKYGRADTAVGHVRRYERAQLDELLSRTGFEDVRMVNYGFPVTEVTRFVGNLLLPRDASQDASSAVDRSVRSSYTRPHRINRVIDLLDERVLLPFVGLQRVFYDRDWGDGLAATALRG